MGVVRRAEVIEKESGNVRSEAIVCFGRKVNLRT